jgi:hypothetical protein
MVNRHAAGHWSIVAVNLGEQLTEQRIFLDSNQSRSTDALAGQ